MNAQRVCVRHSITKQPIVEQERDRARVDAWATWPLNTERGLHMSHGVHEDCALERAHVMQDELGTTAPAPHVRHIHVFVRHITSCDMQSAHYLRLFSRPTHIIVSTHICGCVPQTHTHAHTLVLVSFTSIPTIASQKLATKTTHKKHTP